MQTALEHCDTPDLHRDHGFATLWCGRWSPGIMKQSPFEAFLETFLEHRPALPCFSYENSGPLIVISFVSPVSPSTEERLQDGGDSACGLWFVCLVGLGVLVLFSTI